MEFVIDQSVYQAIREDLAGSSSPNSEPQIVTQFGIYRTALEDALASQGVSGLSLGALETVWCSLIAHGMAPYGQGTTDNGLSALLASTTFHCGNYVSLTWYLAAQFSSEGDNLCDIDWGRGSIFGDHSQLFYSDSTTSLLVDPTVALIVKNAEIPALCNGEAYSTYASFNEQTSISWFSDRIIAAITDGAYQSWYVKYSFSDHGDLLKYSPSGAGISFVNPDGTTTIVGAPWPDRLLGGPGSDCMYGAEGNDSIYGLDGSDELYGYLGNDVLYGGADHDLLDGGEGWDRVEYGTVLADLTINLATGSATGEGSDTLIGVENVTGGSGNDRIAGNATSNVLIGGLGNDSLYGEAGSDALYGRAGNDVLYGGADHDLLDGGEGWDRVEYGTVLADLTINLATGSATGEGSDTLIGVENVTGGSGNDRIAGNATSNVLIGGLGNDSLYGGAGNDLISGGVGADQMYGEAGSDIFNFGSLDEVGLGANQDYIADFDCQFDRLDFTGFDANSSLEGIQKFSFLEAANFSGDAGQLRFGNGTLWGDVNGDRIADFGIAIQATGVLADVNFIL